ncbi:MAG: hypothetical protein ACYDA8_16720 [Deferrisomatales bacterium]
MNIKILVLVVLAATVAGPASGQMMSGGMMHGQAGPMMQGGMCPMCQMMGGGAMQGDCVAGLAHLRLDSKTLEAVQGTHFELQKTAIRKGGDLKILQMELHRLVGNQDFDLDAARKKARAMADVQAELHAAHLEFLHELASKLTDAQWQQFQEHRRQMMMGMMGGKEGAKSKDGSGKDMMGGGMMGGQGGTMQGGHMLMAPKGQKGDGGHHPGSSREAEKFFEKE